MRKRFEKFSFYIYKSFKNVYVYLKQIINFFDYDCFTCLNCNNKTLKLSLVL